MDGIVGTYKGRSVFVINYEELKPEMDEELIYAVKKRDDVAGEMALVFEGIVIGKMTTHGGIDLYSQSK